MEEEGSSVVDEPLKPPPAPPAAATPAADPEPSASPTFLPLPKTPLSPREELIRAKVVHLLVQQKPLPPERVQVLYSWKHSGFDLHAGEPVPPEAKNDPLLWVVLQQNAGRAPPWPAPELVIRRPGISPPPPAKMPSKRWRDLILRVWHVDPLRCPVCRNPMRVIAVIDDPRVVQKILRHLGGWHDPPARPPPQGPPGSYTYEPCEDVDPMPDYENVLTG